MIGSPGLASYGGRPSLMADIVVTAITAFTHDGQTYATGDTLSVQPVVASMLRYRGKVALESDETLQSRALEARRAAEVPVRRRRTYRRRDLSAEV